MKTKLYIRLFALFLCSTPTVIFAQQLKLGDNPGTLQKSALLELESKSQGLLLPRIADTTLATIKASPDGMIIFLTLNNSLCIRANGAWQKLIPEGQAITSLNGATIPVQTITTTNNATPAAITTVGGNHFLNLPDASSSYSGFIGTGIQSFAGAKTFNGNLTANQDLYLTGIAVDNTKDSVLLINSGKVWKKQLTGLPPTGTAGGDLTGTYPNPTIAAGAVTGAKMAQAGATTGQTLKWNGTTWAPAADNGITSIGFNLGAPFFVTPTTLTANGSFTVGMLNQTANTVFASPDGAAGTASFRSLVAADIPSLPFTKITGIVPVAQGGTALTAVGVAGTVLTSNGTSLSYVTPSVTLAGDVTGASGTNTIAAKAVTYAKIQDVTASRLLGRYNAANGVVQEVSLDNSLKFTAGGALYTDSSLAIWNASKFLGRSLSPTAPATGQILKWNGTTWAPAADDNTGSLSSVGVVLPSIFTVTNSPLVANGDITATLSSQTANTVFAAPNGAAGTPTFRTLVAADIPSLPFTKISGTVPIAQGGTALTAVGAAGTVLTSNGTSLTYAAPAVTLAGDVTGASGANTIAAKAVTYAKIQDVNTQKLLGRYTTGTGVVQEVSLDNSLKLTAAGTLYADSSLAVWNASELQGRRMSPVTPTDNYILRYDAASSSWGPDVEASAINWLFTGNSNTTATSFLGTTVDQPMVLKYNNKELFRGTKGLGLYVSKTISLFNGATAYNGHPVIIRANGPDVLAFEDSTGLITWHWNMLTNGLNFVESNVADYRLFLQTGGKVGIGTNTPVAKLSIAGGISMSITPITASYTVTDDDYTVVKTNTGAATITLPSAVGRTGRIFVIKRVSGTGVVTINGGGTNIEGAASFTTATTNGKAYTVQSDGSVWYIIGAY